MSNDPRSYEQQAQDWNGFQLPTMPVPADVQRFRESVAADLTALRDSGAQFAAVMREERTALQAISGDTDSSPAKMSRLTVEAKTAARDKLDALMSDFQARIERVRAAALKAQAAPANPDAVVNELQLSTALGFVREVLGDGGTGPYASEYEAVQKLAASGVPGIIQALRTYLPLYCAKRYGSNPALKQQGTVALMKVFDQAAGPVQAPLFAAARDVLAELDISVPRLAGAYQMCKTETEGGIWIRSGVGKLPAWPKGQLIDVFRDDSVPASVVQTQSGYNTQPR